MVMPWNDSSLLAPPVNMCLCLKVIDLPALKHVCDNIIKVLSKQSPLHKEGALCSRLVYKYDKKFRNDIGYRNIRKVYTALKKYLGLNLIKDVENFHLALPSEDDDEKYLPTRQMLEYVLLRLITFSMIMLRICVCSKQAAIFYLNRIKRGESHWMSLLPYALMSRLWSMSMVLVQHCTSWYSNIYPYLSKLESKGLRFLPDNYELPEDLEQWLDLKNIDCFGRFDWDQRKLVDLDNALLENDDNDLFDNILNFVNESNKSEIEEESTQGIPLLDKCKDNINTATKVDKQDYGQVLSRESFKMNQQTTDYSNQDKMDLGKAVSRDAFKDNKGEALSRDSFKLLLNTKINGNVTKNNQQIHQHGAKQDETLKNTSSKANSSERKKNYSTEHSAMNVTSAATLKQFIAKEETLRNESDSKSLTDHLSFMQWHSLKSSMVKLCDELTNRKIQRKFQKIWKDKCLDYK